MTQENLSSSRSRQTASPGRNRQNHHQLDNGFARAEDKERVPIPLPYILNLELRTTPLLS